MTLTGMNVGEVRRSAERLRAGGEWLVAAGPMNTTTVEGVPS